MSKPTPRANPRIPAPILALVHVLLALLLGWIAPLPIAAPVYARWLGLGLTAFGFLLGVLALAEFKRARAASAARREPALVTSGVYRYTRNPVYLGFALMLIGLPLNAGNYWGFALLLPMVTLFNQWLIAPEENYLEQAFKKQYAEYKSRVRRWL